MNPFEVLRFSFEALKDRKLRSTLTILMVIIGTSLIVSLNGLSTGFSSFINSTFSTLAPNTLIVIPGGGVERGTWTAPSISLDDRMVRKLTGIDGVKVVIPFIHRSAVLRSGSASMSVLVAGIDQTKLHYIYPTLSLKEGKLVPPTDSIGMLVGSDVEVPPGETKPFVRLGQVVTLEYTKVEEVEGVPKTVTVKRAFVVKGILNYIGSPSFINVDSMVQISLAAANSFFGCGGKYDGIIVVTKSYELNDEVEEAIKNIYGEDVGIISPKVISQTVQKIVGGWSVFILTVAAVSLIVAAVGIITTLFTSVMERTKEIGVLKALGFKDSQILILFLTEAVLIGVIGASIGLVVGIVFGSFGFSTIMGFTGLNFPITPIYQPENLIVIWLFTVTISACAGLYPAWRASKLEAVVALRKE